MAKYKLVTGTSKNDWLMGSEVSNDLIYAFDGDDTLFGYGGTDILLGEGGNDRLYGGRGADKLIGGEGADYLNGGSGIDIATYETSSSGVNVNLSANTAYGGDAQGDTFYSIENLNGSHYRDTLRGTNGDNVIKGLGGNDTIYGYGGNDTLEGGDGIDFIRGGDGDDILDGGDEGDTLIGGAHNDTFIGGDGADAHYGDGGSDTVSYEYSTNSSSFGVRVDLLSGTGESNDAEGDTYHSIENVIGSNKGDKITGDNSANVLEGRDGNDSFSDNGGDDTVYGGDGNDTFRGGSGADDYFGGEGIDILSHTLSYEGVTVDLAAGTGDGGFATGDSYDGIERVVGSYYDDILIGDDGDNYLFGFEGEDTIVGGLGDDVLDGRGSYGDNDTDTFVFADTQGPEADLILHFEVGIDKLDFTQASEFTGFNDLSNGGSRYMEQAGNDTVIHYYDHTITLQNVNSASLTEDDFIFA